MRLLKGQRLHENILYAVLWAFLFAAPLLSMFVERNGPHSAYDWSSVLSSWKLLAFFFCVFAVHNVLLAPLLVYGRKKWIYFACISLLVIGFSFYQLEMRPHPEPPQMSHEMPINPIPKDQRPDMLGRHRPQTQDMGSPKQKITPERSMQPHERAEARRGMAQDDKNAPPRPFGGEDMVQIIIVLMLLALNVGVKYYFKSLGEQERLKELERQNLEERLEYLRYQINPHFFMNTLNNIHALVDFDPTKAQEAIEILSGLMRYMLYESNRPFAPLEKELAFVRNYMDIMKIRYEDTVRIKMSLPNEVPDVTVPPLVFTTFLENAFKHGISYEHDSYIRLSLNAENGCVEFFCVNSRQAHERKKPGGVGLKNVRKRLDLLYGTDYSLDIKETETEYSVSLLLPYSHDKKENK